MFGKEKIALGMVQLPPLSGTYLYEGQPFQKIVDYALREASSLVDNGFDGFILQSFEDGPTKQLSIMETVAYMIRVAVYSRETFPDMILGILVNWDGAASLAVAEAADADFIRVEHVYTRGEMTTFGYIEGQRIEVCNLRKRLNSKVKVLADVYECHSVSVAPLPVWEAAVETVRYTCADGLFLSTGTVDEVMEMAAQVREVLPDTPLTIGGGTNGGNIRRVPRAFDGTCAGARIKNGSLKNPVNREWVREHMSQVREAERQESIRVGRSWRRDRETHEPDAADRDRRRFMGEILGDVLRGHLYRGIYGQGGMVLEYLPDYEGQVEAVTEGMDCGKLKRIYACGCGDSYYAGEAARETFYRYANIDVTPAEAYELMAYEHRRLEKEGLVIGVSTSGKAGTSLNCLKRAREKQVWTLGLNNCRGSVIRSIADAVADIHIPTPEEGSVSQTYHYLANLAALFLLALRLGVRKRHTGQEEYEAVMRDICYNLGVMRENAAGLDETAKRIAKQAVDSSLYAVTGHGVNLATARFVVAKLHEAARQGHTVQETEEWAHEERQVMGKDTFTFVLASGAGAVRAAKILDIIDSFGSYRIAVAGFREQWELKTGYRLEVKMADNEAFSPMSLKLPVKLLAYHISELAGVCPFYFDDTVQTKAIEKLIYKENR